MIKFVYYKNTSVAASPSNDETITFGQAFTTQAAILEYNFSISGSMYIIGAGTLNSNRKFGSFWFSAQEGYSSAGASGRISKTTCKCYKNNPQAIMIICGY